MEQSFSKILTGYKKFRAKYMHDDASIMTTLSNDGQQPQIMVIACCDSRVDPAVILQCDPGDLFVVRNVANIVPPYEKDEMHHGTSAALEFGIQKLKVKHLILLGHSQCGGIQALQQESLAGADDFISNWVSIIKPHGACCVDTDELAKIALNTSYQNCFSFPWLQEKVINKRLIIHRWFFDIKTGKIFSYCGLKQQYLPLDVATEV